MAQVEEIRTYIQEGLPCQALEVEGDGRHFQALVVSEVFAGMNRVQRQQRVFQCLGGRVDSGEIHALSMRTYTPEEWRELQHG